MKRSKKVSVTKVRDKRDSEQKKEIKRQDRLYRDEARSTQRLANPYAEYTNNPRVAQEYLYAATETYVYNGSEDTTVLDQISVEEKLEASQDYLKDMDPESTIYGCASCGIFVILPQNTKPLEKTLTSLSMLLLDDDQRAKYLSIPIQYRRLRGVTLTKDGNYYALYRHLLREPFPVDYKDNWYADCSVQNDAIALLCKDCYQATMTKKTKKTTAVTADGIFIAESRFCLKNNVDYGTTHLYLPKLSTLARLMLSNYHVYGHVFKVSGGQGQVALKGHLVAMETDVMSNTAEQARLHRQQEIVLPRLDTKFSVTYMGPMDKWQRFMKDKDGKETFKKLYGEILQVNANDLMLWIDFLKWSYPSLNIIEDTTFNDQTQIDNYIDSILENATTHEHDSVVNLINKQATLNVPGADVQDDSIGEDYGVDKVLLSIDDRRDLELNEERLRFRMLKKTKETLFPTDVNDADVEEAIIHEIRYDRDSIGNEYTNLPAIMAGVFPCHFPGGYPHKGLLTDDQLYHMLNQCSLEFAHDEIFVMYTFNMMRRRKVSQGVATVFKNDKTTLDELRDALNDPEFKTILDDAIKDPNSKSAKDIESWLNQLMSRSTRQIQFCGDRSSAAFCEMLANRRWFGNGAFFLTLAQQSNKQGLFYRLRSPIESNSSNLNGENLADLIPNTNAERKKAKLNSPYADVVVFMKQSNAIFTNMLGMSVPISDKHRKLRHPDIHQQRKRGIFGKLSAIYTCCETSTASDLHLHVKTYTPMSWKFLEQIAELPEMNNKFGAYVDSIISSELSHARSWDQTPWPIFPDPLPIYHTVDEVPMPTVTTLPICELNDLGPLLPPTTNIVQEADAFWTAFEKLAIFIQYHGNHNFSCWKNGSEVCRFKYPAHAWDAKSGLLQIELLAGTDKIPDQIRIRMRIKPMDILLKPGQPDQRCLLFNATKRSSDHVTIRNPMNVPDRERNDYEANIDTGRFNGLLSPCSALIFVVCGGGGGCHNNVQHVTKGGMGDDSYIAKYMTKGIGTLVKCLPLLQEAINANRTSTLPDVETNEYRAPMFALQQSINNGVKRQEYSITLMLASLLHLHQFTSTHDYEYINVYTARSFLTRNTDQVGGDDADLENEIIERDVEGAIELEDTTVEQQHINDEIFTLDYAVNGMIADADTVDVDLLRAHHETEGVQGVEIMITKNNEIIQVDHHMNYMYRGKDLEALNFLEYRLLIKKEVAQKDGQDGNVADDNADKKDDAEVDDAIDDDAIDDDAGDAENDGDDDTDGKDNRKTIKRRGRSKSKRFQFDSNHPQYGLVEQYITPLLKVPILTGLHIPKYPGKAPDESNPAYPSWKLKAMDFATFYITLLVPWSLDTKKPIYDLSWEGLNDWMDLKYIPDANSRVLESNDVVHKGRLRFLINCIESSQKSVFHEKAIRIFRDQSADSKDAYLARQASGAVPGFPVAGNPGHYEAKRVPDEEDIRIEIADIRGMIEGLEHAPPAIEEELRLQNLSKLFDVTNANTSELASDLNASNNVIFTDAEEIKKSVLLRLNYVKPVSMQIPPTIASTAPLRKTRKQTAQAMDPNLINYRALLVAHDAKVNSLNDEQQKYYQLCATHAENLASAREKNSKRIPTLRLLVIGGPGAGKTFTNELIAEKYRLESLKSSRGIQDCVMIAAPTAIAALLYENGSTLHTHIGVASSSLLDLVKMKDRNKANKIRESIENLDLLILDETSMLTDVLNKQTNQRFMEVRKDQSPFGGVPAVLYVGDFTQLPPPVGRSLMKCILYPKDEFDRELQKFRRVDLKKDMRARKSLWQTELIACLRNTKDHLYPLTNSILASECLECRNSGYPTENCKHLHQLSTDDFSRDTEWIHTKICFGTNRAIQSVILLLMTQYARSHGLPVIRWRLPSNTKKGLNCDLLECYDYAKAIKNVNLWGFYVPGMPIRLTFNANIEGRLVNGSLATLTAIRPTDPYQLKQRLLPTNFIPGDIITIEPPVAVYIHCPTAVPELRDTCLVVKEYDPVECRKRTEIISLGSYTGGKKFLVRLFPVVMSVN